METKKNDNKSLIIYTSLIFIVAIVVIIASFLAQKHFENLQVSEMSAENVTLSNKAAMVSEENMQLVELNKTLREQNKELLEQNTAMALEKEALNKEKAGFEALFGVYDCLLAGKEKAAKELLEGIYTEDLTPAQKEIYDSLVKATN